MLASHGANLAPLGNSGGAGALQFLVAGEKMVSIDKSAFAEKYLPQSDRNARNVLKFKSV